MSTRSTARHRLAAPPITPLTHAGPVARRGLAVAASSGLALAMMTSAATAADATQAKESAGALKGAGVNALAAEAREAVTTNAVVTVPETVTVPQDVQTVDTVTADAPVVEEPVVTEAPEEAAPAEAVETVVEDSSSAPAQATTTSAEAPAAAAPVETPAPPSASGQGVVADAMALVGLPYVSGASGPSAFDCSGLVQYVYAMNGISLPRTSYEQGQAGTMVSFAEAQPGDIVYYGYHVGIYAGNGMMIDAGTEATGVVYREIWGSPIGFIRVG